MGIPRNECADIVDGIHGLVTEAWGQGFMVGALIILLLLTVAGMRRGVLLHKLIIAELVLAMIHGTFIFVDGPAAGWYTSSTAALLYISYNLHNIINWIKIKPFLGRRGSMAYIGLVALVWPYWIMEMYLNFAFNNGLAGENLFPRTRPWEALFREPWWIFTTVFLVFTIKRSYSCGVLDLIRISARFGVLLFLMALSIAFIITDVVTVIVIRSPCAGENPFWKIALVFKCAADTVFLDDFKAVLDQLSVRARNNLNNVDLERNASMSVDLAQGSDSARQGDLESQSGVTSTTHPRFNEHLVPQSQGEKCNQPFEHVESATNVARPAERHTTKEWFDTINL